MIHLIKVLLRKWLFTINAVHDDVLLDSDSGSFLICHRRSFGLKPWIYEDMASQLGCGIIGTDFSLAVFFKKKAEFVSLNKVIMWSDSQQLALDFLSRHKIDIYDVFQHGAYGYDKKNGSIGLDQHPSAKAKTLYVWSPLDKAKMLLLNNALNIVILNEPGDPPRKIIEGIGFGTRGIEYFVEDVEVINSDANYGKGIRVFFHPSYKFLSKCHFLLRVFRNAPMSIIGNNNQITCRFGTKSRSMKKLAIDQCLDLI